MLSLLLLNACGGGGGGGDSAGSGTGAVATGSTSSPKSLSVQSANTFGIDTSFNNFTYVASAGERLLVRVILAVPFSDTEYARCASNPGAYATQVHVYDSSGAQVANSCGEDLMATFPANGTYRFNFEYPTNGGGVFYAASLQGSAPMQFSATGDGSPTRPKMLSTVTSNSIDSNPFKDYYWVQAAQGETIAMTVQLQTPLTQTQKTRCASNVEGTNNAQLRVFDSALTQVAAVCGEGTQFVAPAAGTYVIQTDYGVNGGTLNASRL